MSRNSIHWSIVAGIAMLPWAMPVRAAEDNYEPNNTRGTAYSLVTNEMVWLGDIQSWGYQNDDDWYEIFVGLFSPRLVVECEYDHTFGNIDMELYDSGGNALVGSISRTDNEHFDFVVPTTLQSYYIRIYGDNTGQFYNLRWDTMPTNAGDAYEPNDTRHTAWDPDRPTTNEWLSDIRGKAVAGSGSDWYLLDMPVPAHGNNLLVICEFSAAEGNIDIELYNNTGFRVALADTITDNEHIDIETAYVGDHYLRVNGGSPGQQYDMWWRQLPTKSDDLYEYDSVIVTADNDELEDAWYPGENSALHDWSGTSFDLLLGPAQQHDDDWYRIETVLPRLIVAAALKSGSNAFNVSVHDAAGNPIATEPVPGASTFLDVELTGSGRHYIAVDGSNQGVEYFLWWDDFPLGGDDVFEENDTAAEAFDPGFDWRSHRLSQFASVGLQNDDDWYRIDVDPDRRIVNAICEFTHQDGNIELSLMDAQGAVLKHSRSSWNQSSFESIHYTVPEPGPLYLRVWGADEGNAYDLFWFDDSLDSYEQNDTRPFAYQIQTQSWLSDQSGYAIQEGDDWYRFDVHPDYQRVAIELAPYSPGTNNVNPDLAVGLYNSAGDLLDEVATPSPDEELVYGVPGGGTYYVLVSSPGPATDATYNLRVTQLPTRTSYDFEPAGARWTWFDFAPALTVPSHLHDDSAGELQMTETASNQVVFGSWESPKNPAFSVSPVPGRFYRAQYEMRSSVSGAASPGFRFRGVSTHVQWDAPTQWQPDFANSDFNATHEVYYSTVDALHVPGREPGPSPWKTYTLLMYPEQTPTLLRLSMINYFTCDLLDLDTFDNDAGTIRIREVNIDSFDLPAPGTGTRVHELSFNDQPVSLGFQGWMGNLAALDPVQGNVGGIGMAATPDSVSISVTPSNKWFVATQTSAATPLTPGRYYRAIFTISSTETGAPNTAGPTVRAGFFSTRLVFSADKQLTGGSAFVRFGPTPRAFEVWMQAPSEFQNGLTEPMGLRFMSWLGDNPTGWPFFNTVSGQITLHEVRTEWLPPYP